MTIPAYPAARAVASKVRAHFAHHLALARERGRTGLATEPETSDIEALIDAAFWASLRREEGVAPTISLALLPPENGGQAITFAVDLPLQASALAKVAPAVERPGIHLGVQNERSKHLNLRIFYGRQVSAPGCIIVSLTGSPSVQPSSRTR